MAGRVSVWTDDRLAEVSQHFVPAADETWRLQRGTDPECLHFQGMANQGHYGKGGGTRQGIYAMAPSGKLLGSVNSLDADRVLTMLQESLDVWEAMPDAERWLSPDDDLMPEHRWENSFPERGLVLKSACRDVPADGTPSGERGTRWNRDHAWFNAEEARGWLPDTLTVGATREVSQTVMDRLTGYHLVDNVIGQTIPYAPSETEASRITSEVVEVAGPRVTLELRGETRAESDGSWQLGQNDWTPTDVYPRAMTTEVLGKATWDDDLKRFTAFELVALGERTGRTRFNGRGDDIGPAPIGFSFRLAPPGPAERVPPAFIDIYPAGWVVRPTGS